MYLRLAPAKTPAIKYLIFLCLLAGLGFNVYAQHHDWYPPSPMPDRIILSWERETFKSQSINWRTDTTVAKAVAQVALVDASPEFVKDKDTFRATTTKLKSNCNVAHYHSATLRGLKPDTKYAYRVGDGIHWSEWFHFRTASKEEKPFSFLYFGDAQNEVKSMWSRVIREAYTQAPKVDFMVHAGDLVNHLELDKEWGEWFYAGGWMYGMIPSIATPGNHEYEVEETDYELAPHWRHSFSFPKHGPPGLEETVYFVDYQGTRIISLDTQPALLDKKCLEMQVAWLEKVLIHDPQKWTIVTMHHPVFSSKAGRDNPELKAHFKPLFEKYNVDLVLQGHDHTYSRGRNIASGENKVTTGPVYVVSISGPKMYDLEIKDWMERVASNTQLFQIVNVDGNELVYNAHLATGELYDKFKLVKQGDKTCIFYDLAPPEMAERTDIPESMVDRYMGKKMREYNKRFKKFKARMKISRGEME